MDNLTLETAAKTKAKRKYNVPDKAAWVTRATQAEMRLHEVTVQRDKALEDAATLDAELKRIRYVRTQTNIALAIVAAGAWLMGCIVGWGVAHG